MSYIWNNYSEKNKFSIGQGFNKSSFIEAYKLNNGETIVNLLLRFSSIFSLDENILNDCHCEPLKEAWQSIDFSEVINIFTHYLAQKDLINGTYYTDYYLLLIQDEIKKGAYGDEVKERYSKLSDLDKRLNLKYIELKHKQKNLKDLFPSVFMDMFGRINNMFNEKTEWNSSYTEHSAEIYYNKYKDTYFYFCAAEKTEKNENRFELAKLLFADCRNNIVPIWGKYCFGVIDEYFSKEAAIPVIDGIQIL